MPMQDSPTLTEAHSDPDEAAAATEISSPDAMVLSPFTYQLAPCCIFLCPCVTGVWCRSDFLWLIHKIKNSFHKYRHNRSGPACSLQRLLSCPQFPSEQHLAPAKQWTSKKRPDQRSNDLSDLPNFLLLQHGCVLEFADKFW